MTKCDVVIVGAGLVALTAAHALLHAGYRVARLAKAPPAMLPDDDRAIALSASSLDAFKRWQLDAVLGHAAPIQQVHVSVKNRYGTLRLCAKDMAVPCLGKVIAAKHLQANLLGSANASGGVSYEGEVSAFTVDEKGVRLSCKQPNGTVSVSAPLLLVADGAGGFMRQHMALHTMVDDYHQYALAAHVQCAVPHQQVAYERFLATGPVAMLPTPDAQRVAMVWALPTATAKAYAALPQSVFNGHLQQAFGYRLGALGLTSKLALFPLQRKRTRPVVQPGVILLGNAASTLHPVAGQGFNLAVRDVVRLLDVLHGVRAQSSDGMFAHVSQAFEQQSTLDHQRTTQLTHWLAKCFSLDGQYLSVLGGQGLCLMDAFPGFKKWLSRRAMGYATPSHMEVSA